MPKHDDQKQTEIDSLTDKSGAAKFLKVSQPSVDRLRQRGELRAVLVGGCVRFCKADLLDFIERNRE